MNRALLESLAKYKVGDIAHRVALVARRPRPEIGPGDDWKLNCHPKVMYPGNARPWACSQGVPRIGDLDFVNLMAVLTSKVSVLPFAIEDLERSPHTGEILYRHQEEWLPEWALFDTTAAARREQERIRELIALWGRNEL